MIQGGIIRSRLYRPYGFYPHIGDNFSGFHPLLSGLYPFGYNSNYYPHYSSSYLPYASRISGLFPSLVNPSLVNGGLGGQDSAAASASASAASGGAGGVGPGYGYGSLYGRPSLVRPILNRFLNYGGINGYGGVPVISDASEAASAAAAAAAGGAGGAGGVPISVSV